MTRIQISMAGKCLFLANNFLISFPVFLLFYCHVLDFVSSVSVMYLRAIIFVFYNIRCSIAFSFS